MKKVLCIIACVAMVASSAQAFSGDMSADYTVNGSGWSYDMVYDAAAEAGMNPADSAPGKVGYGLRLTAAETEAFTGDAYLGIDGATLTLNNAVVNMSKKDRTGSSARGIEFYNNGNIVLNDSYLGVHGINKKDDTGAEFTRGNIYLNGNSVLEMTKDGGGDRWSAVNIHASSSWTGAIIYDGWNDPTQGGKGGMFNFFIDGVLVGFTGNFQIGGNDLTYGDNHYTSNIPAGHHRLGAIDDDNNMVETRYIQLAGAAPMVVPEPATMALLGLGALVLRRKK